MAYGDLDQYRLGRNVQRLPNPPQLQQPYSLSQRVTQPPRPILPLPQSNYNTQFVNARPAQTPNPQNPMQGMTQSIGDYFSRRADETDQFFGARQDARQADQRRQEFSRRPVGLNQPGDYAPPIPQQQRRLAQTSTSGLIQGYENGVPQYGAPSSMSAEDISRSIGVDTNADVRERRPDLYGAGAPTDAFGNSAVMTNRYRRALSLGDYDAAGPGAGQQVSQARQDALSSGDPARIRTLSDQLARQDASTAALFASETVSPTDRAALIEAGAKQTEAQASLAGVSPQAQRTQVIQSLLENPTLVAPEGMSQGEYVRSLADEILSSGGINQQDISTLRNDPSPEAIAEFNSLYGPGAAQRYLNG